MKKINTFRISLCALFSACATIAFILENLFPPLILPSAHLGISNVFILLSLVMIGYQYAFICLIVKVIIGSLFSGNVSALMYSLPAGLISLFVETLLVYFAKNVSMVAISVCGAVVNSTLQNTVFCLITSTTEFFIYLPYLALISCVSGAFVGLVVLLLYKNFPKKLVGKL